MSKMVQIKIIRGVGINGEFYYPTQEGKFLRVTAETAKQLIRTAKAEIVKHDVGKDIIDHAKRLEEKGDNKTSTELEDKVKANATKKKPEGGETGGNELTKDEQANKVKEIIMSLDANDKEIFNGNGEALCSILSDKAGFKVTKDMRDEATLSIMEDLEGNVNKEDDD